MAVKHAFVSAVEDGSSTGLVRPSNWNADHTGTNEHTHADSDNGGILAAFNQVDNYSAQSLVLMSQVFS